MYNNVFIVFLQKLLQKPKYVVLLEEWLPEVSVTDFDSFLVLLF